MKTNTYVLVIKREGDRVPRLYAHSEDYSALTHDARCIRQLNKKTIKSAQVWHIGTWVNTNEFVNKCGSEAEKKRWQEDSKALGL